MRICYLEWIFCLVLVTAFAAVLASCKGGKDKAGVRRNSDAGQDGGRDDTGTETNEDTDIGSDTDTDTDSDVDGGSDSGADADVGTGPCSINPTGPCDDGDPCTTGDTCQSGVCIGGALNESCTNDDGCCPQACNWDNDNDCERTRSTVSAGWDHTCMLADSGRVMCWGKGGNGELGYKGTTGHQAPVYVADLNDAVQIASGKGHTCALRETGEIVCWGDNTNCQLGISSGTVSASSEPVAISGIANIAQIVAGDQFTCALLNNSGGVRCWGYGDSGRLGNNNSATQTTPQAVLGGETGGINLSGAVWITAGQAHACALLADGKMVCWGAGDSGRLGNGGIENQPVPVYVHGVNDTGACDGGNQSQCLLNGVMIEAGVNTTCAIHNGAGVDGLLSCWGANESGENGTGESSLHPKRVRTSATEGDYFVEKVIWVTTGGNETCAIIESGGAFCWGSGEDGRLGTGDNQSYSYPRSVANYSDFVQISAAMGTHACALRETGDVMCMGAGTDGRLGDAQTGNKNTPQFLSGIRNAVEVDSGEDHGCAVTSIGEVYCFGDNSSGELGLSGDTVNRWGPVKVPGISNAVDVATGAAHSCALLSSGQVSCWGSNINGEIGDGVALDDTAHPPTLVANITSATEIAGGRNHTCVLENGGVLCWGLGTTGQLGNNEGGRKFTPVQVHGVGNQGMLADVVAIGAGYTHTCAVLQTNGEVVCWGENGSGRLGNNSNVDCTTPVKVLGVGGAGFLSGLAGGRRVIDGGAAHTCVVATDGKAYCWGNGDDGRLGNDAIGMELMPVQVLGGMDDFIRISAFGQGHVCVVRSNHEVACWGLNDWENLGYEAPYSKVPVGVDHDEAATFFGNTDLASDVISVATGYHQSFAVHANGIISTWGSGANGRKGNGTSEQSWRPKPMAQYAQQTVP